MNEVRPSTQEDPNLPDEIEHITAGLIPLSRILTRLAQVTHNALQEKIVSRVLPFLKKGGTLLYITCSVFREENEDRVTWLQQEKGLNLVKATYLEGYAQKADTLYAAFFTA